MRLLFLRSNKNNELQLYSDYCVPASQSTDLSCMHTKFPALTVWATGNKARKMLQTQSLPWCLHCSGKLHVWSALLWKKFDLLILGIRVREEGEEIIGRWPGLGRWFSNAGLGPAAATAAAAGGLSLVQIFRNSGAGARKLCFTNVPLILMLAKLSELLDRT